jgi:RNA polymerase sigma factor (sigma-70 family)
VADFEEVYRQLAPRLERLVARNVTAPRPIVEEACQVAWSRLFLADPPVPETARLGWLATTAVREAIRARRKVRLELPLDDLRERGALIELPAREPGPEQIAEMREQLAEIRRLPVRQRQVLWLQSLGYRYTEIATETGQTRRTVERQLLRAKRTLRENAA